MYGMKFDKKDPDYFKKIGQQSARKRKLTSADYSEMAKASHGPNSKRRKKKTRAKVAKP